MAPWSPAPVFSQCTGPDPTTKNGPWLHFNGAPVSRSSVLVGRVFVARTPKLLKDFYTWNARSPCFFWVNICLEWSCMICMYVWRKTASIYVFLSFHMGMNLRPSLQKQHPCKSVPGHHVFKTALGHGDPVFVFGFWQKCQFQFYMWGEMMLQAVAIEIESLPKGLQNYITVHPRSLT